MKYLVSIQHHKPRGGGIVPIGKRLLQESLSIARMAREFETPDPEVKRDREIQSAIGRRPSKLRDKEAWFRWMRDREGVKAERKQAERAERSILAKAVNL